MSECSVLMSSERVAAERAVFDAARRIEQCSQSGVFAGPAHEALDEALRRRDALRWADDWSEQFGLAS